MTLVINEIHLIDEMRDTAIVAAADRLVSLKGVPIGVRKKLFDIKYLNATISYYGLAGFSSGTKEWEMAEFLRGFIRRNVSIDNLGDFSRSLREDLAKTIPKNFLKTNPSGFHICGYGKGTLPELWHLTNVGKVEEFKYGDFRDSYFAPSEDFLARDAVNEFGWTKGTLSTRRIGKQTYRNGDFRAHVVIYEMLDELMKELFAFDDFSEPRNDKEYGSYCKFKLEVISFIYKKWAKHQIIGPPIDVVVTRCKLNHRGAPDIVRFTI